MCVWRGASYRLLIVWFEYTCLDSRFIGPHCRDLVTEWFSKQSGGKNWITLLGHTLLTRTSKGLTQRAYLYLRSNSRCQSALSHFLKQCWYYITKLHLLLFAKMATCFTFWLFLSHKRKVTTTISKWFIWTSAVRCGRWSVAWWKVIIRWCYVVACYNGCDWLVKNVVP